MSAAHGLRTWPDVFHAMKRGEKSFELRKNDRGFAVGDVLLLAEYEPTGDHYSGEVLTRRVTYLLDGEAAERFGCKPGYCIMAVEPFPEPQIHWRATAEDNIKRATAAESDRDAWKQRAERAEKERDEALAMLPTHTNVGLWNQLHNAEAALAAMTKERDEARAEVEHLAFLSQGYAEENGRIKSELDATRRSVGRLEKELAETHDTDGQPWNMTTADAEELRARRKLDEWERKALDVRQVGIDIIGQVFADCAGLREYAPTHLELARKLGLI